MPPGTMAQPELAVSGRMQKKILKNFRKPRLFEAEKKPCRAVLPSNARRVAIDPVTQLSYTRTVKCAALNPTLLLHARCAISSLRH